MWLKALLEAFGKRAQRGTDRAFRIPTDLPAQAFDPDGSAVSARVLNLSARGFKIHLPKLLRPDQEIFVHIYGRAYADRSIGVEARTIWSRKRGKTYDAGLEFVGFGNTPYDLVVQFFKDEVKLDVRETARSLRPPRAFQSYPMRFSAYGDLRALKGVVQNISATGLRFHGEEQAPPGSFLQITLELPQARQTISLHATVRRCTRLNNGLWDIAATMQPEGTHSSELLEAELARLAEQSIQ